MHTKMYRYLVFNMSDLRIVKGNTFSIVVEVKAYAYDGKEIEDFDLLSCTDITITAKVNGNSRIMNDSQLLADNKMQIFFPANIQEVGSYSLEVTGKFNEIEWRFYNSTPIFDIVYTNEEAQIPKCCFISDDIYSIEL